MIKTTEEALALLDQCSTATAYVDCLAVLEFKHLKPDREEPPENNLFMYSCHCEEIITKCTATIEIEPDNPEPLFKRGCAYYIFKDEYDKAIADFTAAYEIEQKAEYLFHRGYAYYRKKEYDKAIADYTAAIKIKQKEKELHKRGFIYLDKRDYRMEFGEYLYYRGCAYHCKDDYENAIVDYTIHGFLRGLGSAALRWRGCAYACNKEYGDAFYDFQEAAENAIRDEPLLFEEALKQKVWKLFNYEYPDSSYDEITYIKRFFPLDAPDRNTTQAIADYTAALEIKPNNTEYLYYLSKEYDKAIVEFTAVLEIEPNNPEYLYERGWVHYCKKEYDKAIADFTAAGTYLKELGDVYFGKGEYDKAITYYTAEIEAPTHILSYTYYARSRAYECNKEYDKALADLRKVLKLDIKGYSNHYNDMQRLLELCDS